MENKKSNKGIIIILILIILALIGYIVYGILNNETNETIETTEETTETIENQTQGNETYNYSGIKGLYEGKNGDWNIQLYLEDDGTFVYNMQSNVHGAYLGNYIIEDNQLKLNTILFEGNGAGLGIEDERLILIEINSNNELIETQNNPRNSNEQVTLTRIETDESFVSGENNFYTKIDNTTIYNNTNS